ncbi:hypothetical protein ACFW16_11255 [Inquilinus sp. NPDC058860]|uniref:hypothetical protein n=1 Tax=Inquilinus sp. NPDC058860 TaxID=3346652 RepID=UPI0036D0D08E
MTTGATPFQHLFRRGAAEAPPLLLLHGSEMDEQAMTGFAAAVAPDTTWIAPRGQVPVGDGWAFFRRHPDRTLDTGDLALRAGHLGGFVAEAVMRHGLAWRGRLSWPASPTARSWRRRCWRCGPASPPAPS